MRFGDWFEGWRRNGETKSTAILRLHVETGLAPMTIRRALDAKPVRPRTARKLAEFSGGEVDAALLTLPPESEAA